MGHVVQVRLCMGFGGALAHHYTARLGAVVLNNSLAVAYMQVVEDADNYYNQAAPGYKPVGADYKKVAH